MYIQLALHLFAFLILAFLTFYLPGFWCLVNLDEDLEDDQIFCLSFGLGIVIFTLLAVILGFLNLRFLSLPIIAIIIIITFATKKFKPFKPWASLFKNKILTGLLLIGIIIQGFINFPSGLKFDGSLLFWSSQGHDGIWHVAVMEAVKKNFPPQNPIYSGEMLYNYHYLVDVLMGEFARIFGFFNSLDLYFRFFPVLFSFFIGVSVFALMKKWQNIKIAYWSLFFVYLVGSFGFVVTFIKNGRIFAGETTFWVSQLNTILGNPPHAISIGLMVSFLLSYLILTQDDHKSKIRWMGVCTVLALSLAGFKISAGIVLLAGLFLAALSDFIFRRKFILAILAFILLLSNLVTVKLMTKNTSSFLIFMPWWFIRTMIVAGERLNWVDLELRRQFYLSKGTFTSYLRIIQLESFGFVLFLVGNSGIRILGFFEICQKLFKKKYEFFRQPFEVMLLSVMLVSFLIPLLFLQKGIVYNSIQFMQYFILILGFYGAISFVKISERIKNIWLRAVFILLVISLAIPTVFGNLVEFYGPGTTALASISQIDLQALTFLNGNSRPDDVILNPAFDRYLKNHYPDQPRPIYSWYSTAYIAALSGRRTYLSDEDQVDITGYDVDTRRKNLLKFFSQQDIAWNQQFLKSAKINFVYLPKGEVTFNYQPEKDSLKLFYQNQAVSIYKTQI